MVQSRKVSEAMAYPKLDPEIVNEIFRFDASKDLRQKKTKKAVEFALIDLLQTNDVSEITISALTRVAEINRKTFYNNYDSIENVLESIEAKISAYLFSKLPEKISLSNEIEILNFLTEFSIVIEPYKEMFRNISKHRNIETFLERMEHTLTPYIHKSMMQFHIDASVIPFVSRYVTSGLSAIYYEWFQNDNLTPQQVAQLAYNLIIASVKPQNYESI